MFLLGNILQQLKESDKQGNTPNDYDNNIEQNEAHGARGLSATLHHEYASSKQEKFYARRSYVGRRELLEHHAPQYLHGLVG